jgi:hypothetical protein
MFGQWWQDLTQYNAILNDSLNLRLGQSWHRLRENSEITINVMDLLSFALITPEAWRSLGRESWLINQMMPGYILIFPPLAVGYLIFGSAVLKYFYVYSAVLIVSMLLFSLVLIFSSYRQRQNLRLFKDWLRDWRVSALEFIAALSPLFLFLGVLVFVAARGFGIYCAVHPA